MDDVSINTDKYSKIVSEIERFIEAKQEKPASVKGTVEKIDLSNNILTVKLQPTKRPELSRGAVISIKEDSRLALDIVGRRTTIRATIRGVYNSRLKIEIETNSSQFENKKVVIDTNKTNVILERLRNVVENIKSGKLSLDNVRILDFIIGENKPSYNKKRVSFISKRFNENQKEAVTKSIEANDFHLVIGPPGTGKTDIIEELIGQFAERNQKTMVTAWTNLAVDNIIKRLFKKGAKKVVRIGPITEIDPEVRRYSIFEKMKEHEDWKEVESLRKIIKELFNNIQELKSKRREAKENINKTKDNVSKLKKELDELILEKTKYEEHIPEPVNYPTTNVHLINEGMDAIEQRSNACLSLGSKILRMNNLQELLLEKEFIQDLKKQHRRMKIRLIGKKIPSFFSQHSNIELKKLQKEYEKNQKILDEIHAFQKEYNHLKKESKKEFNRIYPAGNGHPDEDALGFEFELFSVLNNEYLPAIKEQEEINSEGRIFEINLEVDMLHLESLDRKIDLLTVRIKSLNTELYIQINHKKNLHRQYVNSLLSLDSCKKNVNKLIKTIISEIINGADLIAVTAVSSAHYFLEGITFDTVIMDESSQVASFMSLLPLLKCKKFVLVGDDRQLQPIEEKGISKEMNLSIFNRLFELYPNASTLLTIQYRMHKTIAQIASDIFYDGKLRTSEEVAERILSLKVGKHQFLNPKIPVVFIDTSRLGYYEDEVGSGCSNTKEAEYVTYIVSVFIKNGIKTKDIGVVTPYVKQRLLIKEFLNDIEIEGVEVDTVHKFQGREKDIILMSFARSKKYSVPRYKLRFIESETLVNVAITRAKKKLILVGNSKTLCQSKLLDTVVNKIGKNNTIIL